ncbi:MAG: hypothetical protein Q9227_008113 [Pyrenula ochraceoflavens]
MRLQLFILLIALFVASAIAIEPQKAVVVTYKEDTPSSVIDEATAAIEQAGGHVTHVYHLIKGFAAKATDKTLETVKNMGSQYLPNVQEDSIVSIDGDIIENGHTN